MLMAMLQLNRHAIVILAFSALAPLACHIARGRTEPPARAQAAKTSAAKTPRDLSPAALARRAPDDEEAIAALRAQGASGLRALLNAHAVQLAELSTDPAKAKSPAMKKLRRAIDVVAGQRDAHLSGLFWHTDLERAKEQAQRTSRPILSLRMLGRLDEELSCANSRMFRTLLYPHAAVKRLLSESFVLHWSSERPVPRIDIDMRDGRKLTSTITGNSVHYVLDAAGNPIDAIPGLHGATEFVRLLTRARDAAAECRLTADPSACVSRWHAEQVMALEDRYLAARTALPKAVRAGMPPSAANLWISNRSPGFTRQLQAFDAGVLALGKGAIELPLLERMRPIAAPQIEGPVAWWERLVRAEAADFDPGVERAMALKIEKPDPAGGLRASLALTVSADSLRNEFVLHARIHRFFASDLGLATDLEKLNQRVYDDVFLTPRSDPWLGLVSDEVYDALEG